MFARSYLTLVGSENRIELLQSAVQLLDRSPMLNLCLHFSNWGNECRAKSWAIGSGAEKRTAPTFFMICVKALLPAQLLNSRYFLWLRDFLIHDRAVHHHIDPFHVYFLKRGISAGD